MNERLSYTEQVEDFRPKPDRKSSIIDYEENKLKKQKVIDAELKSQLLETCDELSLASGSEFTSDQIYKAIREIPMFSQKPSSLFDHPLNDILNITRSYYKSVESQKRNETGDELVEQAITLESRVNTLKGLGKSNTEIIRLILTENETGELTLPHEKLILYKKFLDLSASQEYVQDSQAINSIIDQTLIDFNNPGSFEIVLQNIYRSDLVSDNTKVKIEQQFGIPPIRNGLELRRAVTFREKLHAQYMKAMGAIDSDIEMISQNIEGLIKALQEIQVRIEESPTFEEQFELEDKRDELKRELDRLENNRLQLQSDKENLEEKLPLEEAVLLNGRLTIEDGVFSLKIAHDNTFSLPEGLSNNELADMANSYFIWQEMNSLGLAHTLFPEEDLSEGKLPSGRFINFVSRFLGTFNLSHAGSILSLEELHEGQGVINRLRSPETLDNKLMTNEEGAKKDLELLGIIHSEKVNYDRLDEILVKISISDKSVSAFDLAA